MQPELQNTLRTWLAEDNVKLAAFDFDGTLSPIPLRPADASFLFTERGREALRRLTQNPRFRVAVISGRAVHDLITQLGFTENLVISGNHGFEIRGEGFAYTYEVTSEEVALLEACTAELKPLLADFDDVCWEEKGLSNAIFFKTATPETAAEIAKIVDPVLAKYARLAHLANGFVYELFPDIQWHKGCAAAWIAERFGIAEKDILFAGDEVNDEPAFRHLRDAITVKVGDGDTAARYRLSTQTATLELLEFLDTATRG